MKQRFFILCSLFALILGQTSAFAQSGNDGNADSKVFLPMVVSEEETNTETDVIDEVTDVDDSAAMVARIYFDDQGQLHDLVQELDVFEEPTVDGYVVALISTAQFEDLRDQGVRVELDAARTAALTASLAQHAQASASGLQMLDTIPGYACYRTVEETYNSLSTLAANNPILATWTDIGDTWEKTQPGGAAGYDVYALKLTNSAIAGPKPKFFLMAAIHAREYTTAETATRFAEELIAKYNIDADVTWMLDHYEVHIVPQVNPDGRKKAEAGQLWRKNTDNNDGCNSASSWGTDLNRNSSFKWGLPGASANACDATYRGPSAVSEPETQNIEAYADLIFPDQRGPADTDPAPADAEGVFITLHSYSELVLFPWGYTTTPAPNTTALQTLGRKFGYFNGYQVCNGPTCLYGVSGVTDDYTYGKLGVASYTFELGQNFFESCSFFTSNILPKNMPALYYALKSARRPYQSPAGPDALSLLASPITASVGSLINLTAAINDTRYNSNGWGTEPTQAIQAARYSIDHPSWKGATTFPLAASDGAFSSNIETVAAAIDTTNLSVGRHIVFVEGQDAAGNWGAPTALFIWVTSNVPTPTPTNTPLPTNTPTSTNTPVNPPTPTFTPTNTPTPIPVSDEVYVSSSTGGTIGGVAFEDEDILKHNVLNNTWSMIFDGSDVGISVDLDAFTRHADGSYLMSFDVATTITGIGAVDDSDVVKFVATSLGTNTAGTFSMVLDGSDVGLDLSGEDIDALTLAPNGNLVVSTLGSFALATVAGQDEDLIEFAATSLGDVTAGTWSLYFDGSDVGLGELTAEDVNGVWIEASTGKVYLSTLGNFTTNSGLTGDSSDIVTCTPGALGDLTACTWSLYWDGSLFGFGAEDTDDLFVTK